MNTETLARRRPASLIALLFGLAGVLPPAAWAADAASGVAEEPAPFAWSRATLDLIAAGDPARGEAVAERAKCAKCHGDAGIPEDDSAPSIAGQIPAYAFKQLLDFKTGVRESKDMQKSTRRLSVAELADLAAWFATLPKADAPLAETPPTLVSAGDEGRLLLPCDVCHGRQGEGLGFEVPAIAGQPREHLFETMIAYRNGERENDHFARMRFIASQLSEAEIAELADYYARQAPVAADADDNHAAGATAAPPDT